MSVDFSLSPEQEQIRATFHAFAEKQIRPRAAELDEKPEFPRDIFLRAGELGFFGMRYAPPLGSGADITSYVLAVEEPT